MDLLDTADIEDIGLQTGYGFGSCFEVPGVKYVAVKSMLCCCSYCAKYMLCSAVILDWEVLHDVARSDTLDKTKVVLAVLDSHMLCHSGHCVLSDIAADMYGFAKHFHTCLMAVAVDLVVDHDMVDSIGRCTKTALVPDSCCWHYHSMRRSRLAHSMIDCCTT